MEPSMQIETPHRDHQKYKFQRKTSRENGQNQKHKKQRVIATSSKIYGPPSSRIGGKQVSKDYNKEF
jgi:uncharacterized protein YgiM (DUF1202 family)